MMKELTLLPVAPLRFTVWVASKVAEQADREQNSPEAIVRQLQEIEQARQRGDLDEEQAAELEVQVLGRAGGGQSHHG
jgi:Gas vesicle protein G